jgi:quinol-cytochrome oxidoreductase complex cytochrome b subunit/coenzyme F420-reducing hydrogenase delta subunit
VAAVDALVSLHAGEGASALVRRALRAIERGFDRMFGAKANPWHHLGALGFYLFWIVLATGIYLYAFFDTSVAGAHRSVERMTIDQWYAGGVIRSLHRYAADAFVLVVVLHLAKELVFGRFRGFRWFSWVSGVPLLWLMFASGVTGYWLAWDRLAQFVAVATTEWLDWLPIFSEPLARNFVSPEAVSDRLFTLLMFLHLGIPLALLAGMYVHVQRISHADVYPARALAWGTTAALVVLSIAKPALGQGAADLATVPQTVTLDWFYLFLYPILYWRSPAEAWVLAGAVTLGLVALPWLARAPRVPVARVDPNNCNGCARCFADCPFEAIVMERPEGGRHRRGHAVVLDDLCAGCGVCVGSCPSATPFRSGEPLVTGIDLPQRPIDELRRALEGALAKPRGAEARIIVFGCDCGARVDTMNGPDVTAISLTCAATLPPSFIEYAIRNGADGVIVAACREGECAWRLGARWTIERVARRRAPRLRANVPAERLQAIEAGTAEEAVLAQEISRMKAALADLARPRRAESDFARRRRLSAAAR